MDKQPKHIHIVGIAGVATSALAIAFHKKGYKVTGSDKGFFPPVSTELERHGVPFYAGYHPENMGTPDLVIAGTASGTQNPETAYAKEHNIPIKSDAEIRGEFFAKSHSVVCAGTWGKTSSTALLSFILRQAKYDPSFVIGGLSLSIESGYLGDSNWSVIEGDEYKSSPWDNRPKFAHLHTTHLLLTAVSWDHADLYPTEADYFKVFEDLVASVGFIVACKDHDGVRKVVSNKQAIWYGKADADYIYSGVKQSKDGLDFMINGTRVRSPMIGAFQAENITGCFAMARELGVSEKVIVDAIAEFGGLKRRLEKRLDGKTSNSGITIFDDIAHSPEKASAVIKNLREIYDGKITIIFEPNIGGRRHESAHKYDNAFAGADTVIIPHLTKLKIDKETGADDKPFEGQDLTSVISKTHNNTKYMDDDTALVESITTNAKKGDVIAFLGSHGFRGMIESTVDKLK